MNEVNRPELYLAPALSLLLNDEANLDGNLSRLKQMDIKDLLISVPGKDIHNQLWNTNAPLYKSGQTETIRKILSHSRMRIILWMVCIIRRMKNIWTEKN